MMASTTSDANVIPQYVAATAAIKKNIPAVLLTEILLFFCFIGHITSTVFSIREFPPWLRQECYHCFAHFYQVSILYLVL